MRVCAARASGRKEVLWSCCREWFDGSGLVGVALEWIWWLLEWSVV